MNWKHKSKKKGDVKIYDENNKTMVTLAFYSSSVTENKTREWNYIMLMIFPFDKFAFAKSFIIVLERLE